MYNSVYLAHHGVKGMKWGIRRYQNEDGTLTEAGKKRAIKDAASRNKWSKDSPNEVPKSARTKTLATVYKIAKTTKVANALLNSRKDDLLRNKAAIDVITKSNNIVKNDIDAANALLSEPEKQEKRKQLLSGFDAVAVYNNKSLFTVTELRDFNNKMKETQKLKDYAYPKMKTKDKKMDLDKFVNTAKTVKDVYDKFSSAMRTTGKESERKTASASNKKKETDSTVESSNVKTDTPKKEKEKTTKKQTGETTSNSSPVYDLVDRNVYIKNLYGDTSSYIDLFPNGKYKKHKIF